MSRPLVLVLAFLALAGPAVAETIESTLSGGAWSSGSTWVGGTIPDGDDHVVVSGPVTVSGSASAGSLEITAPGILTSGTTLPSTLTVSGPVVNQGLVDDGTYAFVVVLGGDLTNHGTFGNDAVRLSGSDDRHLVAGGSSVFEADLLLAAGASGDILVDTPFSILGDIDTGSGRMVLGPSCPLTLREGRVRGKLWCEGNGVRFESWSYLEACTVDAGVLEGSVPVAHQVRFTGGVVIEDELRNNRTTGSSIIPITGTLTNRGLIRNDTYGLTIALSGDLVNEGLITCSYIAMDDLEERHVSMGPEGVMSAPLLFPEFGAATVTMDTASFTEGIYLGQGGTMILSPGSTLSLTERGSVSGGTLLANGNVIYMAGTGFLDLDVADQVVLDGTAQVQNGTAFTGGLLVRDTLRNWEFANADVAIEGTLRNEGALTNNVRTLSLRLRGDLQNVGVCENDRIVFDGTTNQLVEVGLGLDVPEVVLQSNLAGSSYQWYRDDEALPGETGSDLTFVTVGEAEYGVYHCVGNGSLTSRSITIDEGEIVVGVGSASVVPGVRLEAARPNPFRTGTDLTFVLDEPAGVRLSVYDVSGREVARLADGHHLPGRHSLSWRPDGGRSGVFFVRLRTQDAELVQKLTHLR